MAAGQGIALIGVMGTHTLPATEDLAVRGGRAGTRDEVTGLIVGLAHSGIAGGLSCEPAGRMPRVGVTNGLFAVVTQAVRTRLDDHALISFVSRVCLV